MNVPVELAVVCGGLLFLAGLVIGAMLNDPARCRLDGDL